MAVPVYKVLLIGDANVGKSSIIRRLLLGEFDPNYIATPGVDLSAAAINLDAFTPVILTLIDLGGQEDFKSLNTHYYQGAHFAALVYDIADRNTFNRIPIWYDQLVRNVAPVLDDNIPVFLVGNKRDREKQREVPDWEGRMYAVSLDWPFYETSALTGENIQHIFLRIAKELYGRHPPVQLRT